MAKKRKSGEGTLRKRADGRWEGRVVVGYDENNNYREDMVMELLFQAAEACLQEDAEMVTVEIVVKLTHEQGQWWVLPEKELLEAISGGILK